MSAHLDDPEVVSREYSSEAGLLARSSIYTDADGVDPNVVLIDAVVQRNPDSVLEVGCGPGGPAQRLRKLGIAVRAIDISPRMVELARERGVHAEVGDVQELALDDASFDCVIAAWVLYHVPDLDRGLREIVRVLEPGGCLVAVTNSARHLDELWKLIGQDGDELPFSAENAREILKRHFSSVEQRDVEGTVTFPDRDTAHRYVAASIRASHLADRVPDFDAPLPATRRNCILIATKG